VSGKRNGVSALDFHDRRRKEELASLAGEIVIVIELTSACLCSFILRLGSQCSQQLNAINRGSSRDEAENLYQSAELKTIEVREKHMENMRSARELREKKRKALPWSLSKRWAHRC
jgi:hypothetical protein